MLNYSILRVDPDGIGAEIYRLINEMYPICRSISGEGVRETLQRVREHIPLRINEVPTGTQVFDWIVPPEWNIRDAYVKNPKGEKVIDFRNSNLHVVSYSVPVKKTIGLSELRSHLHTLPDYPEWIPYRTSYYQRNWGFCLAHKDYEELEEGEYEVEIDSTLEDGHLTLGEYYIQGESEDEVLISVHTCHPSLCNDNLSGIAVATFLAKQLSNMALRYSYRFLFLPATIGPIAWLSLNESSVTRVKHGLVLAGVGDAGNTTYKKSRRESAEVDMIFHHILKHSGTDFEIMEFSPYGYDQRQYCSPGFNLPIGCLMRTPYGTYPEYHTSADNLRFVSPAKLGDSFQKIMLFIYILENNGIYINKNPKCEPQLGKRGLYRKIGGYSSIGDVELALLWILSLSDGHHSLLDIAEKSGISFRSIRTAVDALLDAGLLEKLDNH